jgi:hypothetical protein
LFCGEKTYHGDAEKSRGLPLINTDDTDQKVARSVCL